MLQGTLSSLDCKEEVCYDTRSATHGFDWQQGCFGGR